MVCNIDNSFEKEWEMFLKFEVYLVEGLILNVIGENMDVL